MMSHTPGPWKAVDCTELLEAAKAALHYMRLHNYADQSWADDLERAIAKAEGRS